MRTFQEIRDNYRFSDLEAETLKGLLPVVEPHAARLNGGDEVVQNLVGDALIEDAAVPEFDDVVLQRLELDTQRIGDVGDANLAEIRQAGLRAKRGELRTLNRDLEVAFGPRIGKRLEGRA